MGKQTHFIKLAVVFVGLCLAWPIPAAGEAVDTTSDPNYRPNRQAIEFLQQVTDSVQIVVFHGTWCKDCQREIPRFKKILEIADNPNIIVTEYEVNPQKKDALGKFQEYQITLVPTFIVIRDNQELGRITETPQKSLEEDLAAILDGTDS
ncbi:MAG: thioredoxin family protein [Deltaproteobacteria bacterium]|jgi:thiol-disulfide isomerase/thioredoxin|nr:thioredoxin family protein [Deltaproteobacteria bacterium]MBW2503567.1 thioredoxin family protein [Deltaproteobacteria bacterium]MBW2519005.1 thioredoxin family protein [Deltaproteobacteria bacterium]